MNMRNGLIRLLAVILCCSSTAETAPRPTQPRTREVVRLWAGQAPGTEDWKTPEEGADVTLPTVGKIHVITNVTVPTLTVFRPATGKANGTAMVILPGGSFRALAWDVDGLETAQWLCGKGITAFVLKYRVRPPQKGESFGESLEDFARATKARRAIAVADAEQAIRFIRSHARQYAVTPNRVGIIGFSAGAMATVEVALAKDPAVRPNFGVSMYGAALTSEVPSAGAPPLFIGAAQDDPQLPATNSIAIFQRWTAAGLPAELHVYEKGGHGFGFRRHHLPADAWPASLQRWLASHGYLPSPQKSLAPPTSDALTSLQQRRGSFRPIADINRVRVFSRTRCKTLGEMPETPVTSYFLPVFSGLQWQSTVCSSTWTAALAGSQLLSPSDSLRAALG